MKKSIVGIVTKKSGNKTAKVKVTRIFTNKKYNKQMKACKQYLVHDEQNQAIVGSQVVIQECRPLSKHKSFYIVKSK